MNRISCWVGVICGIVLLTQGSSEWVGAQTTDDLQPRIVDETVLRQAVQKIPYKTVGDVELNLHVFNPEGHEASDQRPAIVFFFGGGWAGGTPSQFYKQAWYLSQRGMVAACAEYRVKSRNKTSPMECVMDGKSAIRFLKKNAQELGINPNQIVAAGGSAGGHVAAATATLEKFNEASDDLKISCRPCALVMFNAVIDNGPQGWGHGTVKTYWKDISPLHNLKAPVPPSLFLFGDQDQLLPVEVAQNFKKQVEKLGGRCDVRITPDAGHGYFNRGEAFLETLEQTDRFLVSLHLLQGPDRVREWLVDGQTNSDPTDKNPQRCPIP